MNDTPTPSYNDLVEALRETQRLLQVWNYDFVKNQFYKNANILKRIDETKGE